MMAQNLTRRVPKRSRSRAVRKSLAQNQLAGLNSKALPVSRTSFDLETIPRPAWVLAGLTCACLLPFLGKAFHVDDTLFLWAAKHIVQHPGDPYGFSVLWYARAMPMSEVMKNPPGTSYYLALVGAWAGWSETVLHFAFMVPAIATILAVYRLGREMSRLPVLAAVAALTTPGFLVSATSVMCDVSMLALWLWAILCWRKGIDDEEAPWLAASGILIGLCALTKYFGASLIPLLLAYSLWKKRRAGWWMLFFLIPVAMLVAYQKWSAGLYGEGLLSGLNPYVEYVKEETGGSSIGNLLVTLCFVGGCTLPALLLIPQLWSRKWVICSGALGTFAAIAMVQGWVDLDVPFPDHYRVLLGFQLGLFLLGGISALLLAVSDFWQNRDADSFLLVAWVVGTFIFTAFLNWTINGRSILPMVPAIAILIARRLEKQTESISFKRITLPLFGCLLITLWVTAGDTALANSARTSAMRVQAQGIQLSKRVNYAGHWGFQYYMDLYGAKALEYSAPNETPLDLIVLPRNNSNQLAIEDGRPFDTLVFPMHWGVTTLRPDLGAGFYSSRFGSMPYAFAPLPNEYYDLYRFDQ